MRNSLGGEKEGRVQLFIQKYLSSAFNVPYTWDTLMNRHTTLANPELKL